MQKSGFSVIRKNGRYLLVLEKIPAEFGLWGLPGGKSDKGETVEEAAIRENFEEIGVHTDILRHLTDSTEKNTRKSTFLVSLCGLTPDPTQDILGLMWFSVVEIENLYTNGRLRGKWVYDAIKKAEILRYIASSKQLSGETT